MKAIRARWQKQSLTTRLTVRGAFLAGTVGSAIILVLFYVEMAVEGTNPYGRGSGFAQLMFHPVAIPFVCLGVSILGSGLVPFGALLGWLVARKRQTKRACILVGAAISGALPLALFFCVVGLSFSPSREEPTLWAAISALLARQDFRLFLVETAAVAAVPGALLGWHLWRRRETWLREIEWVEAGKPLDWRWKSS